MSRLFFVSVAHQKEVLRSFGKPVLARRSEMIGQGRRGLEVFGTYPPDTQANICPCSAHTACPGVVFGQTQNLVLQLGAWEIVYLKKFEYK